MTEWMILGLGCALAGGILAVLIAWRK